MSQRWAPVGLCRCAGKFRGERTEIQLRARSLVSWRAASESMSLRYLQRCTANRRGSRSSKRLVSETAHRMCVVSNACRRLPSQAGPGYRGAVAVVLCPVPCTCSTYNDGLVVTVFSNSALLSPLPPTNGKKKTEEWDEGGGNQNKGREKNCETRCYVPSSTANPGQLSLAYDIPCADWIGQASFFFLNPPELAPCVYPVYVTGASRKS